MTQDVNGPRVLIGIPVLNRKDDLSEILGALLELEYPHRFIRIALVDGDSTDGSFEILKKFKEENENEFAEVQVVRGGFRSLPKSRNYVISKLERSDFIWFIDSDVVVNSDSLEWLLKLSGEGYGISTLWQFDKPTVQKGRLMEMDTTNMACTLIQASTIRKVGYFDERLVYLPEDLDYSLRARDQGDKIAGDGIHFVIHLAAERFKTTRGLSNRWSFRQRRTDAFLLWMLLRRGFFGVGADTNWPVRWAFFFLVFLSTAAGIVSFASLGFNYFALILFLPLVGLFALQGYKRRSLKKALSRTANALLLLPCTLFGSVEFLLEMKSSRYRRRRNLRIFGVSTA